MPLSTLFPFSHSFARDLPDCGVPWQIRVPSAPCWFKLNMALAQDLGLKPADLARLEGDEGLALFSGQGPSTEGRIQNGHPYPFAQAYAGHQFGHFSPSLGDGRAVLLGEMLDRQGHLQDIALKGSGATPFSRNGDGLAALGPMLREYLVSEAMSALGVPSTRTLGVYTTGEAIRREGRQRGAVLVRVAHSHLRVGTFEYFSARQDLPQLSRLLRYSLRRHVPGFEGLPLQVGPKSTRTTRSEDADLALQLLQHVVRGQARLIAQWMGLGFIHGVMNTDNMTISGQTIDYGPCAFMEAHDPDTVFSSIDRQGRYAYGRQPLIAQWNVARLAESLLPLMQQTWPQKRALQAASDKVQDFSAHYQTQWQAVMRQKFGVDETQHVLVQPFLQWLHHDQLDHTLAFRRLSDWAQALLQSPAAPPSDFWPDADTAPDLWAWLQNWRAVFLANENRQDLSERMQGVNPLYIPRNHLVEEALHAAEYENDLQALERLLDACTAPYTERAEFSTLAQPASPEQRQGYQTFCGT